MSKRTAFLVSGALLVATGLSVGAVAGAAVAAGGSDDTVSTGYDAVSTSTHALVTEPATFGTRGVDAVGRLTATLSLRGTDKPVFVGVGPAAAVDKYLAGATVDRVTDFEVDPLRLTTERRTGSAAPAPPGTQTFWTEHAVGDSAASIKWKLREGSYRLVVMNADGSAGVTADARAGLRVAHLSVISAGTLAAGALAAILGVALIVLGLIRTNRRGTAPPRPRPAGFAAPRPPVTPTAATPS